MAWSIEARDIFAQAFGDYFDIELTALQAAAFAEELSSIEPGQALGAARRIYQRSGARPVPSVRAIASEAYTALRESRKDDRCRRCGGIGFSLVTITSVDRSALESYDLLRELSRPSPSGAAHVVPPDVAVDLAKVGVDATVRKIRAPCDECYPQGWTIKYGDRQVHRATCGELLERYGVASLGFSDDRDRALFLRMAGRLHETEQRVSIEEYLETVEGQPLREETRRLAIEVRERIRRGAEGKEALAQSV